MLDISKAFDSTSNEIILKIFASMLLGTKKYVAEILFNKQKADCNVIVNNQESALRNVVIRVPQGSVIGQSLL